MGANADPNICMKMVAPLNMNIARGSLAVASFLGAGSNGGGAAMFAGGRTETKPTDGTAPQSIPWAVSDYYVAVSSDGPILDLAWFNLSVPRFDLAGIGFDISRSGGKQQALFAGGTTADRQTSDAIDAFTFGSAIPDL